MSIVEEVVPTINLKRIERARVTVSVVGTSPLIVNRFSEKAKAMMLDAMQSKTRVKKSARDPNADFERSMYRLVDGRHGFPAVGFKAAMVNACRLFDGVKMTEVKQSVFIAGVGSDMLVPLRIESEPIMREDTVRVGVGVADLRFRAEYFPWSADLDITFIPSMLSVESVVALVDAAGVGGIGEWRPEKAKTGMYGTFQVPGEGGVS